MTTGDDELVDAADDELSPDLLVAAPVRVSRWLLPPVVLVFSALVGMLCIEITLRAPDAAFSKWIALSVCGAIIVMAMILSWAGRRAYRELTDSTVRAFLRINVVGPWALSAVALAGGIISGVWLLVLLAYSSSIALYFGFAGQNRGRDTEMGRTLTSLRPAVIVECLFAIIAPPIAALISVHVALPDNLASHYVADALLIPIIGILVLVFVLRGRRPRESV